jgi:hypothetical protein
VRFNDSAEAMLRRTEFSILKEFKNVSSLAPTGGEGQGEGATASPHYDFDDWQPFIIYRCVIGSQAFGLSGDDSDVDISEPKEVFKGAEVMKSGS